MTGPIDPIRPVRLVRRQTRPAEQPPETPAPVVNVTVNVAAPPPTVPYQPPTNLDAHLAAQDARVRGLRGGQNVLDTARSVYLKTEWSGVDDRRTQTGRITKTDV
ncbi:MAG TPA: hypothetical protein VGI95_06500 [Caulobacteraceae bacterium]|jgi:hypothetical protein